MERKTCLMGVLLVCLVLAALTENVQAVPSNARKYQTSCATCHEAFPRLNSVGTAFRNNGYRFVDDEIYIKDEPLELGDEAYKRLWPNAIWPTNMSGLPPISMRILSDFSSDIGGTQASRTKFDFPHEVELFALGTLGDKLSYFAELEWEGGEMDAVATFTFNDLFGPENAFNMKVGTLQGCWAGVYTARDGDRFTKNHYLYGDWRLPYPSQFGSGSTKNTYRVRNDAPGVELNGFGRSWYYAVGILEGDSNLSEKDFFAQIAYKIGGTGFDGSGADLGEEDELEVSTDSWVDDSLTLSGFFNSGKRLVNETGVAADERTDDFWQAGGGLLWKNGDLQLGGGYFFGENDNPYGTLSSASIDSKGWFVETSYFYKPWLIPTVRYETRDLDMPSGGVGSLGADQKLAYIVPSLKILLRANVALTLEGRFRTTGEARSSGTTLSDANMLWARLDFAF